MAARKIRNEVALQDDLPCRGLRRFRLWMDVVGAPAKVDAEKGRIDDLAKSTAAGALDIAPLTDRLPVRRRQALWWGLAVLVIGGAVAVGVGEATGWPVLRGPVERQLTRAAGVPVVLAGDFRLRLLGAPSLATGQLTVGAASGVAAAHLLDAQGVRLDWRWRDLLRWRGSAQQPLRLRALQAAALDAQLIRQADGRASWHIGRAADDDKRADRPLPHIEQLALRSGVIAIDDRISDTRLRIEVQGGEGDRAPAGGYQARIEGRYRGAAVRGTASAGAFLPLLEGEGEGEDGAAEPSIPLRLDGAVGGSHILFDGTATALFGARRLQGSLQLRGSSLAAAGDPLGITLPDTPPFALVGELRHDAGVWQLRAERATIGRSRLAGDFRYDRRRAPPLLSGRLEGPRLALQDLGRAIGTGAGAAPAGAADRVLPQRRFDLPSLRVMDADVQVAIDELDFGSAAVAPMRGLRTRAHLERGVLQLQALQASVAGGKVTGSTQLDGSREPARWAADLRFEHLDVATWIRALRPAGASAPAAAGKEAQRQERARAREDESQPLRAYLGGVLAATTKVQGSGRSTAEILASLEGRAQLRLHEGSMSHLVTEWLGIDLAQALGVKLRGDRPLALRCGVLDLGVERGVALVRRGVLDNRDSTIRIDGRIDLREEKLALRATSHPKDFSPLALRTPVLVSGTLADPQVGIEGQRVAGRVLLAATLGLAVGPVAGLLPLIDPGAREPGDPCIDAPAAASAASAPR
jgi:uncharacterized protein involved in outer membrane biogenesis